MEIAVVNKGDDEVSQELQDLQHRADRMHQLHEAQESHHHKDIWTKDAHGGPYTKVVRKSQDAVSEGLQRAMVLGSTVDPRPEAMSELRLRLL